MKLAKFEVFFVGNAIFEDSRMPLQEANYPEKNE